MIIASAWHRILRLPQLGLLTLLSVALVAGGCTVSTARSDDTPVATPSDDTLRVLVWNVLHGANDVVDGAEKALAIIRESNADLVLMQESYDIDGDRPRLGEWLAGELGWNQHQAQSAHLCVLTPMELETTFFHHESHGVGAQLRDAHQRELLAWSNWID